MYMIGLLIISLVPTVSWSQFSFGGYFQNSSLLSGGEKADVVFQNDTELQFDLGYKDENWRMAADLRLGVFYGYHDLVSSRSDKFLFVASQNGKNNYALGLDVARLYLKINAPGGFITMGRSYLSFGYAHIFNTLEWNKSFQLIDPLATKPGINMFAWDIGIGPYGKMKFFVGSDDEWDTPLAATELILGVGGFEFGTTYQYKGHYRNVLGAFFKADVILGLFGTYVFHFNDVVSGKSATMSHEFSIGADYSFLMGLTTLMIQQMFYYNSLGATTEETLISMPFGDHYFRGRAYSYTSLQLTVNEFVNISTDLLINMYDASGAVLPKGSFTLLNNFTMDLIMGIFFGKTGGEFSPNQAIGTAFTPNVNVLIRFKASF